jgi:HEAT repeat protein
MNDPHPSVRLAAMHALARHGSAAGVAAPALLAAMQDDDAAIRFQAARAFYDITGKADPVVPVLIQNLRANKGCEMSSVYMLGEIGPAAIAAVDALVKRLQDQSAPPESEGPFGVRFNHSDTERRDIIHRAVLEALGDIGPNAKTAVPTIRSALKSENGFVRASACVAFWRITGQVGPAVEPLVELLETGDWYAKRQSASGLGRIGSAAEAAVPALVRALKDAEWGVRWDAAIALGRIGPKARPAIPGLIELLKKNEYGREAVLAALRAIDDKAAAEFEVPDLNWRSDSERR